MRRVQHCSVHWHAQFVIATPERTRDYYGNRMYLLSVRLKWILKIIKRCRISSLCMRLEPFFRQLWGTMLRGSAKRYPPRPGCSDNLHQYSRSHKCSFCSPSLVSDEALSMRSFRLHATVSRNQNERFHRIFKYIGSNEIQYELRNWNIKPPNEFQNSN